MILLAGIPSETPLEMVGAALDALGADYRFVNQRHVARAAIDWISDETGVSGTLRMGDETIDLTTVTGAYMRLMDDRMLPELEGLTPDDLRTVRAVTERRVTTRRAPLRVARSAARDWRKTAMVIGGSTAAGAGLGAIFGGKKGALIGAAIGGGAGTLFEVKAR